MRDVKRKTRVSKTLLTRAQNLCSHQKALPDDWSDWFPAAIRLEVPIVGPDIAVADLIEYMRRRLDQIDDPLRFIEVAQCAALIHYLGVPAPDVVLASIYDT